MQVTNIFFQKTNSKLHSRRIPVGCAALFISDMISVRQMFFSDPSFFTGGFARSIKARVKGIEIFSIQLLLHRTQCFTETLEMNHLSCPKETYGICNFRDVFHHPEDIIVGGACLLFWGDFVRTTLHNII